MGLRLFVYDFSFFEEELNFASRAGRAVGTVNRVFTDVVAEDRADGAGVCFLRISRTHDFTVFEDRVFTRENHQHDRARSHEVDEFAKEGALFVFRIELFALFAAENSQFRSCDFEAVRFELFDDVTDNVLLNGIGLNDAKGHFFGHDELPFKTFQ